ncbi:MAG: hypothetical protein RIS64_1789 [Bacteroidota bacterium]|jgi:hypothetical protein
MEKKLFSSLGLLAFTPTLLFWVFGFPKLLAPENLIENSWYVLKVKSDVGAFSKKIMIQK